MMRGPTRKIRGVLTSGLVVGRSVVACLVVACLVGDACRLLGQDRLPGPNRANGTESAASSAAVALRYRRVLVPRERLADLTRGHMPLKRDEFARHLAQIRAGAATSESSAARLSEAVYYARLQDMQFVAGKARLAVTLDAAGPALLSLAPCGLAIRSSPRANPRPVEIEDGLTIDGKPPGEMAEVDLLPENGPLGVGADRQLWAYVERSGAVEFEWSLAGRSHDTAGGRFDLELPSAPASRMWLDLPDSMRLSCETGLVTASPDPAIASAFGMQPTGMPDSVAPGYRRWLLELGGHSTASLFLIPEDVIPSNGRQIRLRQDSVYDLSPSGIEASTDLHLDVAAQPLQRLIFLADRSLQLTSVQFGTKELNWSSFPEEKGRWQRVVVEFNEPLSGPDCMIRVKAIGPLALGRNQRLPTLRVSGVLWQEGTARLNVADELVVRQVMPQGCREVAADSPLVVNPTRQRTFHCYLPTANLTVAVDARKPVVLVESGIRMRLGEDEGRADLIARLTASEGEVFRLESYLPADWLLDGLQLEPPDALASYDLQPATGDKAKSQYLVIRLNQAVPRPPGITIRMQVRLGSRPDQAVTATVFRAWRFLDVRPGRQIVAVETTSRHRLRLTHDLELQRLDLTTLRDDDAALLGDVGPLSLVFVDDVAADELVIQRERIDPEFAVSIQSAAVLGERELQETSRIACEPRSGPLQRFQVQFSALREEPPTWTLENSSGIALASARRVTAADDNGGSTGEVWQVELNQPTSEPFVLLARRSCPVVAGQELSLVSVPAAASQSGELDVSTADAACVHLQQRQLTMLPPAPIAWDRYTTSQARLRYEPARSGQVRVTRSPAITPNRLLWAWSYDLASHFAGHGEALHQATLLLENAGADKLLLKIPPGVRVWRARAVGRQATSDVRTSSGILATTDQGELAIPLPAGERFPRVEIEFGTETAGLRGWTQLMALAPEPDCPILDRRWRVWLPSRYDIWPGEWQREWPVYEEPGWMTRFFGALATRDAATGISNLQVPVEISGLVAPRVTDSWAAQTLFRSLDSCLAPAPDRPANLNWADVLRQCGTALSRGGFRLLIDEMAMREMDLYPQARFAIPVAGQEPIDARSLLMRNGFLVLLSQRTVVVTSAHLLPEFRRELHPGRDPQVARLREHGRWVQQLEAESAPPGRFLDVVAWATSPPPTASPWGETTRAEHASMDAAGWTVFELPFEDGQDLSCWVYLAELPRAGGWIALLATTGLLTWLCRRRRARVVLFIGAAAAVAIVAPPLLVPLSSGAFLGSLAAGLAVVVWPRRELPARSPGRASVLTSQLAASLPLVLALLAAGLLLAMTGGLRGQPASEPPKADESLTPAYRVLIPVDADREPVGEHDYLPLPFYEALLRRSAAAVASPKGWLIESAVYQGTLNLDAADAEEPLSEITATFQLRTFEAEQRVRLDLRRRHVELLAARLDGTYVQLAWDATGAYLQVPVPRPGSHELQLTIRSLVRQFEPHRGFEIDVPRLSNARLELQVFGEIRRVEVPGARGALSVDADEHVLTAELGPTDQLRVQWPPQVAEKTPMEVTAEELLWLRIKPQSVVVDALFRLTARTGTLGEITLQADPRLRLLRVEPPLAGRPTVRGGDRPTLHLRLAEPAGRELVLRVSLILEDSSGVGNIALPNLSIVADRTKRRWLGVSVAPTLQLTTSNIPPAEPLASGLLERAEFASAWGSETELPDLAFSLQGAPTGWTLATRFHEAPTTVKQRTRLRVGRESVYVRYEADLACSAGLGHQRQIQIPNDMEVRQAVLETESGQVPLEFATNGSRNLTVLLPPKDETAARLILTGKIAVRRRPRLELPVIQLQEADILANRFDIYRLPNAMVEVEQPEGLVSTPVVPSIPGGGPIGDADPGQRSPEKLELDGSYQTNWGRLIARLHSPADASPLPRPAATLRIEPNSPSLKARLVTRLQRGDGTWMAEIDYRVQVEQGWLDFVRLEIPDEWSGPLQFAEDVPHVVRTLPGGNRRQLIVFPPRAVSDEFAVRVRGNLSNNPNETDGVPDFVPLDVQRAERFLVVPAEMDRKPIEWIPSGLQATTLPDGAHGDSDEKWIAYRVVGARPQVTMRQGKSTVDAAQVRLADLYLARRPSGHCLGVATFDLEPAGQPHVTLRLPAEYKLVHVRTDGQPAYLHAAGPGQWQIPLASDRLPQRIEVIFLGRLSDHETANDDWTVAAPQLIDVPVERTAWTIRLGDSWRPCLPRESGVAVSPLRQDTVRLRNLAAVIDAATVVLGDRVQQEVDLWYSLWSARLAAAMNRVSQESWMATSREPNDPMLVGDLRRQQRETAVRLKTTGIWERSQRRPPELVGAAEAWGEIETWPAATTRCAFVGAADSLAVQRQPEPRVDWSVRLAWMLGVLGLTLLVHRGVSQGTVQALVAPWPHLWGVVLGLAWWFWLWPAFVGWVIVVISVLSVFRQPWKAVIQTSTVSTVIRREAPGRR